MALGSVTATVAGVVVGAIAAMSPKIAQQWERAVVLRLGRYVGLRGPGPFWVIPFVDKVGSWIDQRTITLGNADVLAATRRLHRARLSAEQAVGLLQQYIVDGPARNVAESGDGWNLPFVGPGAVAPPAL